MRIGVERSPAEELAARQAEWRAQAEQERLIQQAAMQETKLAILEVMLLHGIAVLKAHADGSGDSGALEPVECFIEPTAGEFEECETPAGVEDLVATILDGSSVDFNNDGGFFNLTITAATRECEIEVGWYETVSESNTETETL